MTWEYRGLQGEQGVTRGNTGLQGVTRGNRGLQGVTRGDGGYKGLLGVTKDYRNFFLTRTFPDTFYWSIINKNQS